MSDNNKQLEPLQMLYPIAICLFWIAMCQYASCLGCNNLNERGSYSKPVYVSPVR